MAGSVWEVHHRRPVHRLRAFHGAGRPLGADRRRPRFSDRSLGGPAAIAHQGSGPGGRRRRSRRRLQHPRRRGDLCARRNHRGHECRIARLDRRRVGGVGDRRASAARKRAVVSHSDLSPRPSCGAGAYATLGVAGGIVSVVFCKGLLGARELFRRLPSRTRIWQPALGGLLVGGVLIVVPQVMGVGYEYVDQALNNGLALKTLVLLCAVKLAATIISYASGNAGGIFAPTLYIGAMAGGAVGLLVRMAAPFPTGDPGANALVGMGTLFAGIIRAPMTSVFMIFEITQDYQILVPLMVANLLSFVISRHYQRAPVYEPLLRQDGVHLPSPETTAAPRTWTAADVMAHEASFIDGDSSVEAGWQRMNTWHEQVALVGSRDAVTGTITRDRLMAAMEQGLKAERLAS